LLILGRRIEPFSRIRIRARLSTHAEHSHAAEGISLPWDEDIWEMVTGKRIIKRTVIIKKRAMLPDSS
jgi:hypothetical protein